MLSSFYLILLEGILFSAAAGLVYGIFGSGSGLFLMPGFYFLLRHFPVAHGQEMQIAVATTACTSALLGIAPVRVQWKQQHIDFALVRKVFYGILLGTVIAVVLLNILPSEFLKHLFGVVVISVAIWLWFYNQAQDKKQWSLVSLSHYLWTTIIGLLWFLLGVAIFTVPYLHKCGVDIRRAVGTTTFIATLFSAIAAILLMITGLFRIGISAKHIGFVNVPLLLIAIIPSSVAAYFGAKISVKLPQKQLKKIYSCLIFVIGVIMLA